MDLVKDSYYQTTAFSLKNFKVFNEEKIKASYEHLDLRLFADCPFLMKALPSCFWYDYIKTKKASGTFITKQYIRWIKKKHKQAFKEEVGSKSGFLFLLQMAGVVGMTIFPLFFFLIDVYSWFVDPWRGFIGSIDFETLFWMISISCGIKNAAQFGMNYYDDECGLIFDRPSGTVQKLNCDGTISAIYDFKDFTPKLKVFINTAGQKERTAYVSSRKHGESVMIGQGLVEGAIAWSYLVRFMDVTQPLPDIPEHETTRHLDPVTYAHDEKIGRDPNYWAKMNRKVVWEMEKEDYKKASDWVDARMKLIEEKGVEDLDFLNNLINPAASCTE